MKYALIENGVVTQMQPNMQDGFIQVNDSVVCGMIQDGDNFTSPEPAPKSIQQQIDGLENSVTKRNYREFVMGNQYSIDKINQIDADIAILRTKL